MSSDLSTCDARDEGEKYTTSTRDRGYGTFNPAARSATTAAIDWLSLIASRSARSYSTAVILPGTIWRVRNIEAPGNIPATSCSGVTCEANRTSVRKNGVDGVARPSTLTTCRKSTARPGNISENGVGTNDATAAKTAATT